MRFLLRTGYTLAELEPRCTSTIPLGFSLRVIRRVLVRPEALSVIQVSYNSTSSSISRGKRGAEPTGLEPCKSFASDCVSIHFASHPYVSLRLGFLRAFAGIRTNTKVSCHTVSCNLETSLMAPGSARRFEIRQMIHAARLARFLKGREGCLAFLVRFV